MVSKVTFTCGCKQEGDLIPVYCPIHGMPALQPRIPKKTFKVKFKRTGETTVMAHTADEAMRHIQCLMDEEDDIAGGEGNVQGTIVLSAELILDPEEDEDGD
jgi:hypothetical protein